MKENLVGRYVKCLPKFIEITKKDWDIENGEYLKILESTGICYIIEKFKGCDVNYRIKNNELELMPEGFDPNNIVTELEIEIW